jgi:hypothetical protein
MYSTLPHFVLGFHGCDQAVADAVISTQDSHLIASKNKWDWLGHGIYFWEQNYHRALEWAHYLKENPQKMSANKKPIKTPGVIGAIIDLRKCLNLLDGKSIDIVAGAHEQWSKLMEAGVIKLPINTEDARNLDCAVINAVHMFADESGDKPYDTVRGMFPEGEPLYETAGFRKHNHIQLCVVNPICIKGYFHPIQLVNDFSISTIIERDALFLPTSKHDPQLPSPLPV